MKQRQILVRDVRLAKQQFTRPVKRQTTRPKGAATKRKPPTIKPASPKNNSTKSKLPSLSQLLTPKNIQESVKTVTNLRGMVKNWIQYLGQADQVLDTLFVTSTSLKESGVLDKLVKQKGKNLTTEDFTSVLMAFMNSPLGNQVLKGMKGSDADGETKAPS